MKRSRERIIADLLEATNTCKTSDMSYPTDISGYTFLYLDVENGNDVAAGEYFDTNTDVTHNESVPFATYWGISGIGEYVNLKAEDTRTVLHGITTGIGEYTGSGTPDNRFIENTLVIVNLSTDFVFSEPANFRFGTIGKRAIWCGFDLSGGMELSIYDTLMYCKCDSEHSIIKNAIPDGTYNDFVRYHIFYSYLKNCMLGNATNFYTGYVNIYKSVLNKTTTQARDAVNKYSRYVSSVMYEHLTLRTDSLDIYTPPLGSYSKLVRNMICIMPEKYSDNAAIRVTQPELPSHIGSNCIVNAVNSFDRMGSDCKILTIGEVGFVDHGKGNFHTKHNSILNKAGFDGFDIGIGSAFGLMEDNLPKQEIRNGVFKNCEYDSLGSLSVKETNINIIASTSTTITLQPTATENLSGLTVILFDGTNYYERSITDYDIVTQIATLDNTIPVLTTDTKYFVSAEFESSVIDNEATITDIQILETKTFKADGNILQGFRSLEMRYSDTLTGGEITESYKQFQPNFIEVDSTGLGSGHVDFDNSSTSKVVSKFQQIKIKFY